MRRGPPPPVGDAAAWDQDRTPGLVRELHRTLAGSDLLYRNLPETDYEALVERPDAISAQCDEGFLLGIPNGRQLLLYYEFRKVEAMRTLLSELLTDLGAVALERTLSRTMTLDYTDLPHRHRVDPILIGADFADPVTWSVMRCRDVREQPLPSPPEGITVRSAERDDAEAISALDERVMGEQAVAPPLPAGFLEGSRWTAVAEVDGALGGYMRVLDGERRGLWAEHFVVDPEQAEQAGAALLHAVFEHGRAANRRALAFRVAEAEASNPLLAAYGLKRVEEGFTYLRPVDPADARSQSDEQVVLRVKVGKIFGMFN